MKKSYVFHPLLLAIYAVLAPVANNLAYVGIGLVRTLVTSFLAVTVIIILVRLFVRHKERAGLVATGIIVAFFSYGHIDKFLSGLLKTSLALDLILLFVWIVLIGLWIYVVLNKVKDFSSFNNYLNLFGLILLVFPFYSIFTYSRQSAQVVSVGEEFLGEVWADAGLLDLAGNQAADAQRTPDIYYIILDSYTRADVLHELYDYDNSEFIHALEARGFYVAEESRSNYTDTVLSISSTLNMAYINETPAFAKSKGIVELEPYKNMLSALIRKNKVSEYLKEQGYSTVLFDSAYDRLSIDEPDYLEKSPIIGKFNAQAAFDLMLLDTTLGKAYFKLRGNEYTPMQVQFDEHRERVLYTFDHLSKYADQDGPFFVYAHVISPHTPYIFGPNGEPRHSVDPFTLLEGETGAEWSPDLYRDQVIYINKRVIAAIDEILAKSDPQPVIIIQGDHGSRSYDMPDPSTELWMELQLPILNAYLLPEDEGKSRLYPSITPVNSFRIVLNTLFDTALPLLDDTSYMLEYRDGSLTFVNACIEYNGCGSK